jgi:hypothetical protein
MHGIVTDVGNPGRVLTERGPVVTEKPDLSEGMVDLIIGVAVGSDRMSRIYRRPNPGPKCFWSASLRPTRKLYARDVTNREILAGEFKIPPVAQRFERALKEYSQQWRR